MNTVSCLAKIARHWRAFARAEDGNVAIIFGLSLIPLVGLIGGAIDYSRASAVRAAMQTAADATALAISEDAPSQTPGDLQTDAEEYFNSIFDPSDASNIKVTATFAQTPNSKVVVGASGEVASSFMRIWPFNITEIPVGVSSTTLRGSSNTRLRVALALDNTGSMASKSKMAKLKEATKDLIDKLAAASTKEGDVLVSIVPFSRDVNVGKDNRTANWIRWNQWNKANGSCSKSWNDNKSDCKADGGNWTPDHHSTWNGCVMDRNKNKDVSNLAPDPNKKATLFPADQYRDCPSELIALTDVKIPGNVTTLKTTVNNMYPKGYTNITIGLAWAWQSLTETSPLFAPAEDPDYEYDRIIILLTDGKNTWNRFTTKTSEIDKRTKLVCDNIKAPRKENGDPVYRIYTIRVIEGNKSLLQQCASLPDEFDDQYYHDLKSADEIKVAFDEIVGELTKLRVSE